MPLTQDGSETGNIDVGIEGMEMQRGICVWEQRGQLLNVGGSACEEMQRCAQDSRTSSCCLWAPHIRCVHLANVCWPA